MLLFFKDGKDLSMLLKRRIFLKKKMLKMQEKGRIILGYSFQVRR